MIPSRRGLVLLAVWALLGAGVSFASELAPVWWWGTGALLLLLAVDAIGLLRDSPLRVTRHAPGAFSTGVFSELSLRLVNPGDRPLRAEIFDRHPESMEAEGMPAELEVPGGGSVALMYRLRPQVRGRHRFSGVDLRMRSELGLLERRRFVAIPEVVRAYPNFHAATGYEWMAAHNRAGAVGIRRRPRRGEGLEFLQLREYREGDSLRQIDWKATARLGRAISREYQDERDQQVVFLLDCGRRMRSAEGGRADFDGVLDAVLLAAQVALRQGDSVGLMTFSGERRWLAPRKGVAQQSALLNALYDLESGPRAPDYATAARDLLLHVRKRTLVIWMSNLRDEDAAELTPSLRLLSQRHLVLLVSLREAALEQALSGDVETLSDALRVGATRRFLEERAAALSQHAHSGAILLDIEPERLPVALVNRYLDVKSAGIL